MPAADLCDGWRQALKIYVEESFFVHHAYFPGANDPYNALKTSLKAEVNAEA